MKNILTCLCILLASVFVSCIDIFEVDLQGENVELFAPANDLVTSQEENIFWWSSVTGALWYELQVVSPDFSNVSSLKLDTIIEKSNFQFTLQPGVYHWRVRAMNGSSSTEYTENTLTVTGD